MSCYCLIQIVRFHLASSFRVLQKMLKIRKNKLRNRRKIISKDAGVIIIIIIIIIMVVVVILKKYISNQGNVVSFNLESTNARPFSTYTHNVCIELTVSGIFTDQTDSMIKSETMIFTLQLIFVIFLFAQTYQYRKAWGYTCCTLIVVQSKPTADWTVEQQFTSDTNFAKVSEKKKEYQGWSISGLQRECTRPPPPPLKNITHKSNMQYFLLSFFAQVIIRQLKFESLRTSTKLNFYEIFK